MLLALKLESCSKNGDKEDKSKTSKQDGGLHGEPELLTEIYNDLRSDVLAASSCLLRLAALLALLIIPAFLPTNTSRVWLHMCGCNNDFWPKTDPKGPELAIICRDNF